MSIFAMIACVLGALSKKSLLISVSWNVPLLFCKLFGAGFCTGCKADVCFKFLHMEIQFSSHCLLRRLFVFIV